MYVLLCMEYIRKNICYSLFYPSYISFLQIDYDVFNKSQIIKGIPKKKKQEHINSIFYSKLQRICEECIFNFLMVIRFFETPCGMVFKQ